MILGCVNSKQSGFFNTIDYIPAGRDAAAKKLGRLQMHK